MSEVTVLLYEKDEMERRLREIFPRLHGGENMASSILNDLLNLAGEKINAEKFISGLRGILTTYAHNEKLDAETSKFLFNSIESFFDAMVVENPREYDYARRLIG